MSNFIARYPNTTDEINPANTLHNEDEIFNANIAVRENIINAIKQVIDPEHRIENKILVNIYIFNENSSYNQIITDNPTIVKGYDRIYY